MGYKCPEKKREYAKSYNLKYKEKAREKHLLRLYGITIDGWNKMFDDQNGCCDICGTHQSEQKRRFDVDHNHETGEVRSLLCTNCNTAVGLLQESVENAEKLSRYLRKLDEETD